MMINVCETELNDIENFFCKNSVKLESEDTLETLFEDEIPESEFNQQLLDFDDVLAQF